MNSLSVFVEKFHSELEKLLPEYLKNKVDFSINEGNVAAFVIGPNGEIFGRTYGNSHAKCRDTATIAWKKASQVWLTGTATGEYERKVYNNEVDWFSFGIMKPDLIGWEGGIPGRLSDGTPISLGFSGFRGEMDKEILTKALRNSGGETR